MRPIRRLARRVPDPIDSIEKGSLPCAVFLSDCTGVVIAGGRAVRLDGVAKGLLQLGGEPLIRRALALFGRIFPRTLIVANDPAPYAQFGAPIVPDPIPGKGAPGGLYSALSSCETEWVFAVACDMPFPSEEGIALLAAQRNGADAAVARFGGRLQPLHAFWARSCRDTLERLLREGDPSFRTLAALARVQIVSEETWRAFDPAGLAFENVNTADDVARLGLEFPEKS